ncbi:MAG: hypothetical protein IT445_17360 [Phycisphaeraceae bacterium]|nr:hypothetical protein [Phycisphaeraceae bacterium]
MIDLAVIIAYVSLCIVAGIAYSGRPQNAADYFVAGGKMRGWFNSCLVGLSIAATLFSGISFIMLPSVFFSGGTAFALGLLSFPVAWIVLRFWFLPRYLGGPPGQQPYDIIERRFGATVRTAAAVMFLFMRIAWMAALIYAPTIAILGAWQLDRSWFWVIVLTIGLSSTFYTVIGGIRGVIFTDALQFLIIGLGIVFTVGFIIVKLPVSISEGVNSVVDVGLFDTFNVSPSFTTMTVWAVLAATIVGNLGNYIGDQMSLQRYLACGDIRESSRSFLINVCGCAVVFLMLAVGGIALKMWYLAVPDESLPSNADQVFPYFIATRLPVGVTGLLVAAILAATMSSMTSGINTVAAVITLDFRMRFRRGHPMTDAQQLRFSRISSLVIGVIATLSAGLVGKIGSIFDIVQTLLGALMCPLFACVVLSALRVPLAPKAVLSGMVLGTIAGWIVAWSPMTSLWVGPSAFAVAILSSFLLSMLMPKSSTAALLHNDKPSGLSYSIDTSE